MNRMIKNKKNNNNNLNTNSKSILKSILLQNKIESNRYEYLEPYYIIMLSKEFRKIISTS